MKNYKIAILIIGLIVFSSIVTHAESKGMSVIGPDGQQISLDNLTSIERSNLIKYMEKASGNKADVVLDVVNVVKNPETMDKWRKVITGTIKDVCNDLNVTVNEFVDTPVGIGISALIVYKVMGKDLISKIGTVIFMVPFWFVVMIIIAFFSRRFLGTTTVYQNITETPQEKGKPIITKTYPKRMTRYDWRDGSARTTFGVFLFTCAVIITLICITAVLA